MSRKSKVTLQRLARKAALPILTCSNPECGRARSSESKSGLCGNCYQQNLEPPPAELRRMAEEKARQRLRHFIDCASGRMSPHKPVEG